MQPRVRVERHVKSFVVPFLDGAYSTLTGIGWPSPTGNDVGHLAPHTRIPCHLHRLFHSLDGLDLLVAGVAGVHRVVSGDEPAQIDGLPMGGHPLPRGLQTGRVPERSGFESLLQQVGHLLDLVGRGGTLVEAHDGYAQIAVGDE